MLPPLDLISCLRRGIDLEFRLGLDDLRKGGGGGDAM